MNNDNGSIIILGAIAITITLYCIFGKNINNIANRFSPEMLLHNGNVEFQKIDDSTINILDKLSKALHSYKETVNLKRLLKSRWTESQLQSILGNIDNINSINRDEERDTQQKDWGANIYRLDSKYNDFYYGKYSNDYLAAACNTPENGGLQNWFNLSVAQSAHQAYTISGVEAAMRQSVANGESTFQNIYGFDLSGLIAQSTYENESEPGVCNFNNCPPDLPYYHNRPTGAPNNKKMGFTIGEGGDRLLGYGWDCLSGINCYYFQSVYLSSLKQLVTEEHTVSVDDLINALQCIRGTTGDMTTSNVEIPVKDDNSKNVREIFKKKWKCDDNFLKDVYNDVILKAANGGGSLNAENRDIQDYFNKVKTNWGLSTDLEGIPCTSILGALGTEITDAYKSKTKPRTNGRQALPYTIDTNEKYILVDFVVDVCGMMCALGQLPNDKNCYVPINAYLGYLREMNNILGGVKYKDTNLNQKTALAWYSVIAHAMGTGNASRCYAGKFSQITDNMSIKEVCDLLFAEKQDTVNTKKQQMLDASGTYECSLEDTETIDEASVGKLNITSIWKAIRKNSFHPEGFGE